jgi:uncharacterized MAPEG superfamily protein
MYMGWRPTKGVAVSTELRYVLLSIALGFCQILASSHAASLQRGYRWSASARDVTAPPLTGVAGRLERCLRNYSETFPLFLGAVLVAHLTGRCDSLTALGARLYFWSRVAYVPLYAFGVPVVRSLVWNIAAGGIAVILVRAAS